ncbi:NEK5 [Symbiodinium sp. CCMP2456]|nr:NEK5 [Symbiodinium sp. CCMP2456]
MEEHGYSVMRVLGQGGGCNSRVYEVKDREGQLRVVKQLPWVADTDRENALREVRLLSSMRHPCIVPYLESFLVRSTPSLPSEDILCLVMSRCDRDLRQECLRVRLEWELNGCRDGFGRAHIAEMLILSWLAQLTWGLQHLHSRKFLHRDLKPQNVLLAQHGKRVMLADFGVAGQVEHTEDLRRSIVGTPAFMSPEMLEGRPYNSKTDQWALGCVLFEMMALEPPFAGRCDSYAAVVSAVLHAPPVQAPGGYSPPLSATLEGLLARKPHNRPSNRELLRSDLLRDPFHDFLQSLDSLVGDRKWAKPRTSTSEPRASTGTAAAAGTAVGLARRAIPVLRQLHFAPEAATGGPPNSAQSAVTEPFLVDQLDAASPSDSDLGSPWAKSQELSATGSSMQVGSASARTPGLPGLVEDDFGVSRSPSVSAPHRATSNHTEGCSYASDFESDSVQVGAESNSSGERDLDLLEDFQEPGDSADNVSHSEHGFASTAEWRQLIAEAEALLVPLPEVQATEEAHKLRAALASSLGGEDKVDTALNFLRDRRPLGDTVEADELLLQVELLDLLGDEGILKLSAAGLARFRGASTPSSRAASRPEALADPLALGVSGCGLGDAAAWPASPQSCGGTPPTRRSGRHQSAEPMQMEDVEVEDHVLHPNFRRTDAAPPQVIVTRSNQAAQSRVNLRRSVDQRASLRERDRSMPFSTSLDVDFLSLFAS